MLTCKFLHDWVLDFDRLDGFAEIGERSAPTHSEQMMLRLQTGRDDLPFSRRNDFYDARLHSVLVNLVDKALEVAELIHGL